VSTEPGQKFPSTADPDAQLRDWGWVGISVAPGTNLRAVCGEALTKWVERAYTDLAKRPTVPEFLRQFTQGVIDPITRDSEIWQSLSTDRSLWVWIYCASRADEISDKVGVSEQLFDHSFFELEGEAFLFLNDLLRAPRVVFLSNACPVQAVHLVLSSGWGIRAILVVPSPDSYTPPLTSSAGKCAPEASPAHA
jgi:hypothetical protein